MDTILKVLTDAGLNPYERISLEQVRDVMVTAGLAKNPGAAMAVLKRQPFFAWYPRDYSNPLTIRYTQPDEPQVIPDRLPDPTRAELLKKVLFSGATLDKIPVAALRAVGTAILTYANEREDAAGNV